MLNTLKQFPYLGIMEKVLHKVPRDIFEGSVYKEFTPKEYGQNKRKKYKKK